MRSYTELLQATKAVRSRQQALQLMADYGVEIARQAPDLGAAVILKIVRDNIGYTFGEGMSAQVRAIWESLDVHHPVIDPWTDDPEVLLRIGDMTARLRGPVPPA